VLETSLRHEVLETLERTAQMLRRETRRAANEGQEACVEQLNAAIRCLSLHAESASDTDGIQAEDLARCTDAASCDADQFRAGEPSDGEVHLEFFSLQQPCLREPVHAAPLPGSQARADDHHDAVAVAEYLVGLRDRPDV